MKTKNKSNILWLTFLFLGICSLSYWGVSLLIYDNPTRLQNNRLFNYFENDRFGILKDAPSLGDINKYDILDRKEIGPLPEGKFIVSYNQKGTGKYNERYYYKNYINVPCWTDEPYYDRYGDLRYHRRITHYRQETYWETRYKQKEYTYSRNFSIYDISDQISFFENEDSAYNRMKDEFISKLSEYKHWEFNPIDYKSSSIKNKYQKSYSQRGKAISYNTVSQEGIKTVRSIYFANKRAYVLEVQSDHNTTEHANKFLENITTLNLSSNNKTILAKMLCCFLLVITLGFVFVVYRVSPYKESPIKNKQAKKLYKFAISMATFNTFIVLLLILRLLSNSNFRLVYFYQRKYIDLDILAFLMIATIVVMNLLICTSLYIKSKKEYRIDYLIQDRWLPYFENRLVNIQEKKTLVSLLFYPLFIIGSLPLGFLSLIYVIPFAFIILITIEIRHLYRWINKDSASFQPLANIFQDYYVALDLKKGANKDEIEQAFNSAMAKYNSANGNPLYGKPFYFEIQEAYAVLGSTNQLRPEYDKEYEAYKSNNSTSYSYSNKQLENEILNIRNRLYNVKPKGNYRATNIIIVSFVLLFIIAFTALLYHYYGKATAMQAVPHGSIDDPFSVSPSGDPFSVSPSDDPFSVSPSDDTF